MTDITYLFHGSPPYRGKTICAFLDLNNQILIVITNDKGAWEKESIPISIENAKQFASVLLDLVEEVESDMNKL